MMFLRHEALTKGDRENLKMIILSAILLEVPVQAGYEQLSLVENNRQFADLPEQTNSLFQSYRFSGSRRIELSIFIFET